MAKKSARQHLASAQPPAVHVLDEKNALRMKAKTMLIPSPVQIRDAIAEIPFGQTMTAKQLREGLASAAGADVTCPLCTGIFWRIAAEAADEDLAEGITEVTPWWRLTKDGKPNPKLPGGIERHRALLLNEGVKI